MTPMYPEREREALLDSLRGYPTGEEPAEKEIARASSLIQASLHGAEREYNAFAAYCEAAEQEQVWRREDDDDELTEDDEIDAEAARIAQRTERWD